MKIYSILAHPNRSSLNGVMFDRANEYFVSRGHTVKTFDVFQNTNEILASSQEMYYNNTSKLEKKQASTYYHNYILEKLNTAFSKTEIANLKEADLLFIQTPILVWSLPAMLKMYIENVFLYDELFTLVDAWSDKKFEVIPHMTGKKVVFSFTLGSGRAMTSSIVGSQRKLVQPIKSMFEFAGYAWMKPHITWGTTGSREAREEYLLAFDKFLLDNIKDSNGLQNKRHWFSCLGP
jgi:NAD(P)H dehydrogenase (quinone)